MGSPGSEHKRTPLECCSNSAFARALLGNPALLLLDEPTRSLDPDAVERFWHALDQRHHAAVLLATHNRDDLEHCGEQIDLPT